MAAPVAGGVLGLFIPQLYVWEADIAGEIRATGGDLLDLQTDVGLDQTETSVLPVVQFSFGGLGVRFSAFFLDF
ncbi:MAG: hypothetical protein ACE5JG_11235, partial [Planctomycetota bacterium]